MSPTRTPGDGLDRDATPDRRVGRRRFVALGAGVGATLLAGCSADTGSDGQGGDGPSSAAGGTTAAAGTFRLLISDRPADIDDFDRLDVSFDRARIFRAGGDGAGGAEETDSPSATGTTSDTGTATVAATEAAAGTGTAAPNSTATTSDTGDGEDEPDDGERRGFFVVDLDGATVDLTRVVGDRAVGVFEGSLEEGRYAKVELYAASVEGVVDGEPVGVKIPSGKLQIVKPFEVVAGETLRFVFDINVVRKGQSREYNLLPVISESGVAGEDVDVREVDDDAGGDGSDGSGGTPTEDEEAGPETGDGEAGNGAGGGEGDGPPDGGTEDS